MPTPEEITDFTSIPAPAGADPWVQGRGPSTEVRVVDPDPSWPTVFEELATTIRAALGDFALSVEHVGSTSVPDLPAKPIIDVDVTVSDPEDEDSYVPALVALGPVHTVREPWWHGHRVLRGTDPATHVHVFAPTSPEVVRHRLFRD
ncbi:GrpB family protein [Nocardioides sp. B-3]|uniref:GrpB family protein n=1 Tax=Nocardioides sp. B-3 TaxID=2895565 RepID=UPI0021538474|nr:GrpB family protein [Nocardioides sp. B-3]UUZ60649.1 GrpB family protein [Nocardioides sp. B-3]